MDGRLKQGALQAIVTNMQGLKCNAPDMINLNDQKPQTMCGGEHSMPLGWVLPPASCLLHPASAPL